MAILKSSSSYFLGDAQNDSLQRIYGIAFPDDKANERGTRNGLKKLLCVIIERLARIKSFIFSTRSALVVLSGYRMALEYTMRCSK